MKIGEEHGTARLSDAPFPPRKRPARDDLREAGDVGLCVAAADAQRVQFKDFAAEIFVKPASASHSRRRRGARRLLIVEIEDHRGVFLDGEQHIGEAAKHVRTNRFAFEGASDDPHKGALADRHAEVVRPEGDEPLDQSCTRARGTAKPRQRLGAIDGCLGRGRRRGRRRPAFADHWLRAHRVARREGGHRRRGIGALQHILRRTCDAFGFLVGEIGDERRLRSRKIGATKRRDAGRAQFRQQEAARVVARRGEVAIGATAQPKAVERQKTLAMIGRHVLLPGGRSEALNA